MNTDQQGRTRYLYRCSYCSGKFSAFKPLDTETNQDVSCPSGHSPEYVEEIRPYSPKGCKLS